MINATSGHTATPSRTTGSSPGCHLVSLKCAVSVVIEGEKIWIDGVTLAMGGTLVSLQSHLHL